MYKKQVSTKLQIVKDKTVDILHNFSFVITSSFTSKPVYYTVIFGLQIVAPEIIKMS